MRFFKILLCLPSGNFPKKVLSRAFFSLMEKERTELVRRSSCQILFALKQRLAARTSRCSSPRMLALMPRHFPNIS